MSDQLRRSLARLAKNGENFALMTSFDLENVNPKSQNLHQKDFLCGSTHPHSFVFLARLGAEIAWGHYIPPSPGCIMLRPSPVRVLTLAGQALFHDVWTAGVDDTTSPANSLLWHIETPNVLGM